MELRKDILCSGFCLGDMVQEDAEKLLVGIGGVLRNVMGCISFSAVVLQKFGGVLELLLVLGRLQHIG